MRKIHSIAAMLALAFTSRYGGLDSTMGLAFASTGVLFPFFSPLLGWLGVALTGSDTSSNVLFGNLQRITAERGIPHEKTPEKVIFGREVVEPPFPDVVLTTCPSVSWASIVGRKALMPWTTPIMLTPIAQRQSLISCSHMRPSAPAPRSRSGPSRWRCRP